MCGRGICHCEDLEYNKDSAFEWLRHVVSTDPLTKVSLARLGSGGRCLLFNGPCDHQHVAHGESKPGAKTVGVAHSSYGPILMLWFGSTL
jgi:hypothetical protein